MYLPIERCEVLVSSQAVASFDVSHVPTVVAGFTPWVAFAVVHIGSDLTEVLIVAVFKSCDVVSGFVNDSTVNCPRVAVQYQLVRQQDCAGSVFAPSVPSGRSLKLKDDDIAWQPIPFHKIDRTYHCEANLIWEVFDADVHDHGFPVFLTRSSFHTAPIAQIVSRAGPL